MAGLVFLIFFVLLALGYPIIMCMIGGAITPLAMDAVGYSSFDPRRIQWCKLSQYSLFASLYFCRRSHGRGRHF